MGNTTAIQVVSIRYENGRIIHGVLSMYNLLGNFDLVKEVVMLLLCKCPAVEVIKGECGVQIINWIRSAFKEMHILPIELHHSNAPCYNVHQKKVPV